jgi:hypothetical protein
VAQQLVTIYQAYIQDPSNFHGVSSSTDGAQLVVVQGNNVGIDVHTNNPGDFAAVMTELQSAGMQITASDAAHGLIDGLLPIAQLPTVANLPQAPSVNPLWIPIMQ